MCSLGCTVPLRSDHRQCLGGALVPPNLQRRRNLTSPKPLLPRRSEGT